MNEFIAMRRLDVWRTVPKMGIKWVMSLALFVAWSVQICALYPRLSTQPVQIWPIIQWDSQTPRDQGVSYLTVDTFLYRLLLMTADVFITLVP